MNRCPAPEELRRLLEGPDAGPEAAAFAAHLEGCRACQEALEGLTAGGPRPDPAPAPAGLPPTVHGGEDLARQLEKLMLAPAVQPTAAAPAGLPAMPGYELLEEIGRGGMGVVYKAWQGRLRRVVALKMLTAGAGAFPEERVRLQTEAEALARLQHPNIVQVYEVGEHDGRPYLALEYAAAGSLAQRLGGLPLPPRASARLAEALARAVQAAHAVGVVHRDLKPGNILLASDGQPFPDPAVQAPGAPDALAGCVPKVADFGLAKLLVGGDGTLTRTGAVMGTPCYMAPEQADGRVKEVGPPTDVYALGAILYECLTGRPPFLAADTEGTLRQVRSEEPVPPGRLNAQVPRDLETVCLKCLEKEPGRRYASAEALAEDLRRWQAGEPVRARPVGALGRGWRWCRRNPAVAALLAAVFVVLLAGAGVASGFAVLADRRAEAEEKERGRAQEAEALAVGRAEDEAKARKDADEQRQRAKEETARAEEQRARAEKQWDRAEWLAYSGQMALAQAAWQANRADVAWDYLDRARWDFRGWEHRYLYTLFTSNQRVFRGHSDRVTAVVFSPDGRRLASASPDRTVRVWDAERGQEVLALKGHTREVFAVAFSPDGRRIASASADQTVRVWDADKGREVLAFRGHTDKVSAVAFSPDGRRIASAGYDQTVRVWDADKGGEVVGP